MNLKNDPIPTEMILINYFGLLIMSMFRLLRTISEYFMPWIVKDLYLVDNREGYPTLYTESLYYRTVYPRLWDIQNFIICSQPAEKFQILERKTPKELTGRKIEYINFASYNYLGYSQKSGPIADSVETVIEEFGVGVCSPAIELGRQQIYCELESLVSQFLGVEDAIVFGQGFASNAFTMSALFSKGCLVISDERNHASIIMGCSLSGAAVKRFKNHDTDDLERIVRNSIIEGQPITGRAWNKIIIIMEGIYSMEGSTVNLPEVLRIKRKYKCYLYLDEAHSIGAIGKTGRGICEYYGCDPKDVDILMGSFAKCFAATGGYIAGNRSVIQYMRCQNVAFHYAQPIAPPVIQQIVAVLKELIQKTDDSIRRIRRLNENSVYLRQKLFEKGFHIEGDTESPVVIIKMYSFSHGRYVMKSLLDSGVAIVGVGPPATPMLGAGFRLCVSALHTRSMIDYAIDMIDKFSSEAGVNFSKNK